MDLNPQDDQPTENHPQNTAWSNLLRSIQLPVFYNVITSNLDDNPLSGIDANLFTERTSNTSENATLAANTGHQCQTNQTQLHPLRDIQPKTINQQTATNPNNNPTSGSEPSTERATYISVSTNSSTNEGQRYRGEPSIIGNNLFTEVTSNTSDSLNILSNPSSRYQNDQGNDYGPQYQMWQSPPRDIRPQIFNQQMTPILDNYPTSSQGAANVLTRMDQQYREEQHTNQNFIWPTLSTPSENRGTTILYIPRNRTQFAQTRTASSSTGLSSHGTKTM